LYQVVEKACLDPHTMVKLRDVITVGDKKVVIEAIGMSKRASNDAPNPEIGYAFAVARAEERLRAKRQAIKKSRKK
jgi:hypothetical protein